MPDSYVGHGFSRANSALRDLAGLTFRRPRVLPVIMLLLLACAAVACENHVRRAAEQITGGNPDRATAAVQKT